MIPLALDEIEELAPGRLARAEGAELVTGVVIDSRRAGHGDLFVAVGGGVAFVEDALAAGAAAALVPEDAFGALASLGRAVRERSRAKVVAVTGSTAKTSTKDILGALCAPHVPTVVAEGSQNNEIGLPLTLCRLEEDTEVAIVEMGMRGLGQIAELCEVARPDVGIVTSVGPVHLELLGTVERVAQAKAELIEGLPPGGRRSSLRARPTWSRTSAARTSRSPASGTAATFPCPTSPRGTAARGSRSRRSAGR